MKSKSSTRRGKPQSEHIPKNVDIVHTFFEMGIVSFDLRVGELMTAEVVTVGQSLVVVNAGLGSQSNIALEEFKNDKGELEVKVGDFVTVAIEAIEDGHGATKLSRERAKKLSAWHDLDVALDKGEIITGMVSGKVKGGLTVMVNGIRAFLPGSLVDVRPVKDTSMFEGKELEFKVIKLDRKRNNVVVSRRAVMEASADADRAALIANLKEGATVKGVIRDITDYGAFVDLGGIDGLLHITDLAWRRVKHPSEVLNVGDEVEAKILKFDQERNCVSLGMKQLGDDPWTGLSRRYPQSTRLFGKVTNLTDYGAFIEIEAGIEGLVHVSEMDWTNKNVHPAKVVSLGDEVEVMILEIDEERRRISLGMKQCMSNPWEEFSMSHKKGEKVKGTIKSITDFGVFIGLPGNIDGLVHLSDLSWNVAGEEAVKNYKKGDELEAVVLAIDMERERISLGIKQMDDDPFTNFTAIHDKGTLVKGRVKAIDAKRATIALTDDIEGYLRASEVSRERVEDVRTTPPQAVRIEAKQSVSSKELERWLTAESQIEAHPLLSTGRIVELSIADGLTLEEVCLEFEQSASVILELCTVSGLDTNLLTGCATIAIFPSGAARSIGQVVACRQGFITVEIDDPWELLDPRADQYIEGYTNGLRSELLITAVRI